MNKIQLVRRSLLHALGTIAYIAIVASVMNFGNKWFGGKDTFLTPIAVLSLFVVSACVVGSLILAKPVMLYIDGLKKEAVTLLGMTVAWLAAFTLIIFIVMALSSRF